MNAAVTYVKGDDPVLRDAEVAKVIDTLLDGTDKLYALEDFTIESRRKSRDDGEDDADRDGAGEPATPVFRSILNALSSPPFMTPMRVVVIREAGGLLADQAALVSEFVTDPLDGIFLVLVAGSGRMASPLEKAIKANSVSTIAPKSEKTDDVLDTALSAANLILATTTRKAISARLGDDAGRVPELVALLESTFGEGAQLTLEDVEHYLGESGTVAPYMLTNAIDNGDTPGALEVLHRLLHATSARAPKPMHPLQVMGMLTRHYESLVRIDSPDVTSKQQVATVLGMKEYPAGLRLKTAQQLGSRGIASAIHLLAQADLDFRGGSGGGRAIPSETVIEVLVARLSGLARRSGAKSPALSAGRRR